VLDGPDETQEFGKRFGPELGLKIDPVDTVRNVGIAEIGLPTRVR